MATMTFWQWVDKSIDDNSSIYDMPGVNEQDVMSIVDYIYESQYHEGGCEKWSIERWSLLWSRWCREQCAAGYNDLAERRTTVFNQLKEMYLNHVTRKQNRQKGKNTGKKKPTRVRPQRAMPLGIRWRVLERDGRRCQICGASPATDVTVKLHVDHIVPVSRGGASTMDNLQTLCEACNLGKSNRIL